MAPKQPLPGTEPHLLHGRQAFHEFNSFHQGVGQISLREGLLSCRPLPKRGKNCYPPPPPQSLNDSTVGSEVPQSPSGADTPDYVHIQPTPAATTAPTAAPAPASDNAAPAPPRNPTASIRDRVVRELGREANVRMPGRTRGETRAMR